MTMNKSKKRNAAVLMVVGLLLVVSAVALFVYNLLDDRRAGEKSREVLKKMDTLTVTGDSRVDYAKIEDFEMPTVTVDGRKYIGRIQIPRLNVSLPILKECTQENLWISPCCYKGSAYNDNMILAAHNYSSHFGRLSRLNAGDDVMFFDVDGNRFEYKLTEIETLKNNDVELMEEGEWDLTLFTCTYGGRYRITARCKRVK